MIIIHIKSFAIGMGIGWTLAFVFFAFCQKDD